MDLAGIAGRSLKTKDVSRAKFSLGCLLLAVAFGLSASHIQGLLSVLAGGTGQSGLTSGDILYGLGSSPVGLVPNPNDNTQALCGSNPPAFGTSCKGGGGGGAAVSSGPFSSLPATCAHTSTQSDLFFFTNSLYTHALCTATNVQTVFADGKAWGLPSAIFVNWNNQSTAAINETEGYSVIQVPTSHTGGLAYRYASITPLATFDHMFLFRFPSEPISSATNRMTIVALQDASKCMLFSAYNTSGVNSGLTFAFTVTTYTDLNCTAGGANPTADVQFTSTNGWFYIHLVQDGTNITAAYGTDGNTFTQHFQGGRTAFFGTGATRLGWGGYRDASTAQIVQLVGFN